MKRKQYMISSNHEITRPERINKDTTLYVYDEPDGKVKDFKKDSILYSAYSFAADVEMETEQDEEVFYKTKKAIESELCHKGDIAYNEDRLIAILRKEYDLPVKDLEFVYSQKRLFIFVNGSEYSTDVTNFSQEQGCTL